MPPPDTLDTLVFDNRFVRELPVDPETTNACRQVTGACSSLVRPVKTAAPRRVATSREAAELLDVSPAACESEHFAGVFSGNRLLDGMVPFATCYGGHQFGHWAGQLGDGRVINLGEIVNQRSQRWTLQLKGAGPTPYSRSGDGLAVLRSSVREFLCSEAMFHLGVPTTRALSIVLTGEQVERDMFYDGHPRDEPGAVVCRLAPSFTRFGTFEIFASRGETGLLKQVVDYTIRTDFPHLGDPGPETTLKWFEEVCRTTAEMVVHWMRVGFVHGVMNTDNMSILGLTLDYGPYGWLENYDPRWTPNTTDRHGRRYCFENQPAVAHWNLAMLAQALSPLPDTGEGLQQALDVFGRVYQNEWQTMMARKLGLEQFDPETDTALVTELFDILKAHETDMTIFHRNLARFRVEGPPREEASPRERIAPLMDAYYEPERLTSELQARTCAWLRLYAKRVRRDGTPDRIRRERMDGVNPKYVLRNYMAQLAIDKAEQGDFAIVDDLLELLRRPYDEHPGREAFAGKRPDWARQRAGCSMLSCSS